MAKDLPLEIQVSRHFLGWLADAGASLAFTTYQTNRLFLLGMKPDGRLRPVYVPRRAFTTGDLDVHDVALAGDGRVVFVNTAYSCLATTKVHATGGTCFSAALSEIKKQEPDLFTQAK